MNFKDWLLFESRGTIVYHITYLAHCDNIAEEGLIPNYNPNDWGSQKDWSKGKNFITSDLEGAEYWIHHLELLADNDYESSIEDENNFVERKMIPIIIRLRFNKKGKDDSPTYITQSTPVDFMKKGRWVTATCSIPPPGS